MAGGSGSEVEASGLVNTLQGHVDDIRNLLQCGICIRPLYEPFTLACGHTFCYSCLSSWFSGGRSKRTCPDCRAPVETQPAPAYLVRAVVHMFTSRAELLDKEETTAEHQKNHQEESEKLDKDKTNQNPHNGGLFRGLFRPRPPSLKPLVDVDDGVVRCPYCGWELENDQACGGCGYEYHPDSSGTDYSDDFSETDDYDSMLDDDEAEEDDFGEMDDDASAWGPYDHFHSSIFGPLGALLDHPYHHHHHHHHPHPHPHPNPHRYTGPWAYTQAMTGSHPDEDDYNEEEEEDEYEMDSFIDDEDHEHEHGQGYVSESDHSTVVGGARPNRMTPPRAGTGAPPFFYPPPPPYVTESELEREAGLEAEGSSEDSEDDNHLAAPSQPWEISSSSQGDQDVRSSPMCTDADEEDEGEDEDEDEDGPHTGHGRVYYQPSSISPAPNEESEPAESSSPPRPMRPSRNTGTSARHAITIDDSDDEQPVGPMRRARRQARFSPY
ncbi:uncharacterized protein N7459_009288 [Penicillium hispanicum]|uniref:uncharacterized protein n=1 Tax=Penicillium hispanicum TaxID=1080232 RepID=UPI0025411398|nr:uncharacterized protein N7459_009288 [Penicillium hispanicum]KAJ5569858.1 hypothetical protein N7459_009288 [Penicillium hispanicum]